MTATDAIALDPDKLIADIRGFTANCNFILDSIKAAGWRGLRMAELCRLTWKGIGEIGKDEMEAWWEEVYACVDALLSQGGISLYHPDNDGESFLVAVR